ncbi:response regulator transcription factor [Streptomyces sp. NPDC057963]|uniref:response regulator transcription factor n=1 Tax=Streptomyces sp. NPDC057963 TaxID=3346290 RepID=UPI0036E363DB
MPPARDGRSANASCAACSRRSGISARCPRPPAARWSCGPPTPTTLTPQELEIVRLAADGLTNKQIGQRLYLSPRSIGNHLYHAFPKLGITSRVNLRDALNSPIASDTPHHTPGALRQCLGNPAPAEGDDATGRRT